MAGLPINFYAFGFISNWKYCASNLDFILILQEGLSDQILIEKRPVIRTGLSSVLLMGLSESRRKVATKSGRSATDSRRNVPTKSRSSATESRRDVTTECRRKVATMSRRKV